MLHVTHSVPVASINQYPALSCPDGRFALGDKEGERNYGVAYRSAVGIRVECFVFWGVPALGRVEEAGSCSGWGIPMCPCFCIALPSAPCLAPCLHRA